MKIAVIGGGITGLTAAYILTKQGYEVTIFERDSNLGGLAGGFKEPDWEWSLEKSYHHLFTNDRAIVTLIRELGLSDKLIKKRPITANFWNGNNYQFDSPIHLFMFPALTFMDKFRTGALAAFCKIYPFWQTLEGITAKHFFTVLGGKKAWNIIWEPLMTGKFGHFDSSIAASWLWARINKRTPSLYYIGGGFQTLTDALTNAITRSGGTVRTGFTINSIKQESTVNHIKPINKQKQIDNPQFVIRNARFDKVLLTVPTPAAYKLFPLIRTSGALSIPHLSAQTLILETDQPVLNDVYWLNITDRSYPFLAVVAHTNFMDKKHYGNHHLTYIGNYLPPNHKYLSMNKNQVLKEFLPFIQRITKNKFRITNSYLFNAPFAQPVHEVGYSQRAPKITTSTVGMYLANMDSIYPWDRGTNYAVELGRNAADIIRS